MAHILKSFLTATARVFLLFLRLGKRNLPYFGIMIFWVGGKNCIVKNEKYIEFSKPQYINSCFARVHRNSYSAVTSFLLVLTKVHNLLIAPAAK